MALPWPRRRSGWPTSPSRRLPGAGEIGLPLRLRPVRHLRPWSRCSSCWARCARRAAWNWRPCRAERRGLSAMLPGCLRRPSCRPRRGDRRGHRQRRRVLTVRSDGDLDALPSGPLDLEQPDPDGARRATWVRGRPASSSATSSSSTPSGDRYRDPREHAGGPRAWCPAPISLVREQPAAGGTAGAHWRDWVGSCPRRLAPRPPALIEAELAPRSARLAAARPAQARKRSGPVLRHGCRAPIRSARWNLRAAVEAGVVAEAELSRRRTTPIPAAPWRWTTAASWPRPGLPARQAEVPPGGVRAAAGQFTCCNCSRWWSCSPANRLHKQNFRRLVESAGSGWRAPAAAHLRPPSRAVPLRHEVFRERPDPWRVYFLAHPWGRWVLHRRRSGATAAEPVFLKLMARDSAGCGIRGHRGSAPVPPLCAACHGPMHHLRPLCSRPARRQRSRRRLRLGRLARPTPAPTAAWVRHAAPSRSTPTHFSHDTYNNGSARFDDLTARRLGCTSNTRRKTLQVVSGYDFQLRTWVDNFPRLNTRTAGDRLGQFKTPVAWTTAPRPTAATPFLERLPGRPCTRGAVSGADWTGAAPPPGC